jgi:hypothetical protein
MPLPPSYPDFQDESVALGIVRRYVKKGSDDELIEQLNETMAQDAEGDWFYRPYYVAYLALKSNPRWLIKGQSGRANGEWRDLSHALEALTSRQASQDATLGLIVPDSLQPEVPQTIWSGAVPMVWGG